MRVSSQKDTSHDTVAGEQGSLIGSTDGSVHMQAGNTLHVTGSDIVAAQDVTGIAANVTIDGSQTNRHHDETHESKTTGFSITASAPVIDAAQNTLQQASAGASSQDARASALHAMAAASGAYDAAGAAQNVLSGKAPDAKIELSWGSSSSKSMFTQDTTNNTGSTVKAGGTAAFVATGGNVNIAGSDVNANNVILSATNQVNLTNSTDTDSTRSTNESKSAGIGVSVGTGGIGIDASMSKGHGSANSDSTASNNTHINAANNATIVSGGDTNLIGANVNGKSVNVDVGGNLNIASTQDTTKSDAHQSSTGGGIAISGGGASGSFSTQQGNANSNFAGVTEQSGIHAGTDGFAINVKGGTDLKGAVIASDATADKNSLTTGTLSFSDLQNNSSYDAKSSGVNGGASVGTGGNTYATHGSTSGNNMGGIAPMLSQNDSGNVTATTRSAISAGTINVTDQANQKQDIASLSRDTTNTNGTVNRTPDLNNLLNNQADMMAATSAAGEAVARRIGDYADAQAKATGDPAWAEGGQARAEMQAAGAALIGGLGGGVASAAGSAAGAGLSSLAAGQLNALSDSIANSSPTGNADMDRTLGNIVANAIATGAGAAAGGGDAGAFAGYNVDHFNRQLHQDSKAKEQTLAKKLADGSGGKYTPEQIEDQMAQMNLTVNGQTESGGVRVATGTQPQDGTDWQSYGVNKAGQQVWAQSLGAGDPDLQSYIANGAQGSGLAYQATTTGSNPGLVRAPDFVNFQVDYFVGSAWGTFTRDGNSFFGTGVNMALPNPVQASASITAGWLNQTSVRPGQVNNFAGGYAGGATGAYGVFGGGIMYSPGNGTATIMGIGGGISAAKNTNIGGVGGGNAYDQGKTGIGW